MRPVLLALISLLGLSPAPAEPVSADEPAGARGLGVLDTLYDALEPPAAGGLERVDRLLGKLATHRRLMVVGAHPDDEDTTVLALVVRGQGGEAAYLSLSRGDGGQNLIGPELGVGLGLLRSRELQAARRIDGARQLFTRAYDFGYTRSLEETFERWPREALLEDAVRAIRRFKPQVIVSVFPPDERAGHGQHQASGVIAGEAFTAAGDAGAFPGLAAEGLAPWRPEALYRAAWWRPEGRTVEYSLSVREPVSGRSIFQIAMASRSQHRCQDMGMLQPLGPFGSGAIWEAGGAGEDGADLFAGVDTSLAGIAARLPAADRAPVAEHLAAAQRLAEATRRRLNPVAAESDGELLDAALAVLRHLRAARALVPADAPAAELIAEKIVVATELAAAAAGIGLDAYADTETLVPGGSSQVETVVWDAGGSGVEPLAIGLETPEEGSSEIGWRVEPIEPVAREGRRARFFGRGHQPERGFFVHAFEVGVPAAAEITSPYFLARPLAGDLFDWSDAAPAERGEPFGRPPLIARFRLRVRGEEIELRREVIHRFRDQVRGEVRRPIRVVPAVEIAVGRDLLLWPAGDRDERRLEVVLTSHAEGPLEGVVGAEVPAGWPAPAEQPFRLAGVGERQALRFTLEPPSPLPVGRHRVRFRATVADSGVYDQALPLVDYPHIRPVPMPVPAAVEIAVTDLELPRLSRVAYVRGASDRVPEALAQVGVPIEVVEPEALATGELAGYDAVIVGSRAYETEPALAEANARLLDYAREGGLVIVQYQQYQYTAGGFAPYALEIARPHGRVTDETAPIVLLEPEHAAFTRPNRLNGTDWDGWVQERGLYMPAAWEPPFAPLLETADPGGEPQRGGLLVAPVGEGTYVYTGLAFFRQLPAGVPGAFRLFANLLGLGQADGSGPNRTGAFR